MGCHPCVLLLLGCAVLGCRAALTLPPPNEGKQVRRCTFPGGVVRTFPGRVLRTFPGRALRTFPDRSSAGGPGTCSWGRRLPSFDSGFWMARTENVVLI